jgi:hypothetical protein
MSGWCCPSFRTVVLLLHAIFIIRTERPDSVDWRSDGCNSSIRLAFLRIASRWNTYVVRTVAAAFPYLYLEMKSFYLSNTERRPDMLLIRPNGCNLKQFETSGHWWESRLKDLIVRTDVAWQMSVWMEYHVVRTNARDLNFTILNSAQSLLEAHNRSVDSEYNRIPN